MPKLSARSIAERDTCHPDLVRVINLAVSRYDLSVICGHRGQEAQDEAFKGGFSRTPWPESNHNQNPSRAVDLVPYPLNWENVSEFYYMAGVVMAAAAELNVPLRWGGRWTKLKDLPHFELI